LENAYLESMRDGRYNKMDIREKDDEDGRGWN
jgi:hypothetical protein